MKKFFCLLLCTFLISTTLCGCSKQSQTTTKDSKSEDLPVISLSWGQSLHTAMLQIPINRVDEFKKKGVYLNKLSDDKYELIENDKKLAIISYVPNKGASEVATLMGQNHLDSALCSNTGILSAIDKGTDIKILCPVQTGGIGLVFPPDTNFYGWEEVKKYILSSKTPVKIGYHSPVSGPRIVLETVLREEGIKVTEDPNDPNTNVLLVDLKGTGNLLPSITAKQVDAWVAPSHFPEAAEAKKLGKVVLKSEDFPPAGKWSNFPCCVFSAREEVLKRYPEVFKALIHLLDESCKYFTDNREDASKVLSGFVGIDENIIKNATINYTTEPTKEWESGISVYVDALNKMNKFSGRLKGKPFDEVLKQCFDFSYTKK